MITARYFSIWQSKEISHDFVRGQSVAETYIADMRTRQCRDADPTLIILKTHHYIICFVILSREWSAIVHQIWW